MNHIDQNTCEYLSPNKTVEELTILRKDIKLVVYVYNYQGISFRVFRSKEELNGFWSGASEEYRHFETEMELDEWLHSLIIK